MATSGYLSVDSSLPVKKMKNLRTYHPDFSFPDADITLRSLEGTLYRVHSHTLRSTSGLFKTIFELPQPVIKDFENNTECGLQRSNENISYEEIPVFESYLILDRLLRLLYGFSIPEWESCEDMERVLMVAEKWDAPGPIVMIRAALYSRRFLTSDPLRLYVLARHFEWKEEARLASTETLKLNLREGTYAPTLARLSPNDLLLLLDLHGKRQTMFKELLNSPARFTVGNSASYSCDRCGATELDNYTWREFKNALFSEISRRPMGDTLGFFPSCEGRDWSEATACWEAKCKTEGCGGKNYDKSATLRQIRNCVDLLPLTIDD